MSERLWMPPTAGKLVKIHRQPGFYVGQDEAIVDVQLASNMHLTFTSPFEGKIIRTREVGYEFKAGELVTEVTSVGTPTWELFVAYRRKDAPGHAGHVGKRLMAHFGGGQVFKDIEALPPGADFEHFIRHKLQLAYAMVVIIGPNWVNDPRLQDPADLHREEIRTALERGLHIFPVLVQGATMPLKEQVPQDIRAFINRQAVEITDTRWDYDMGILIRGIESALMGSPKRQRFLAQVPPWDYEGKWHWIADNPEPGDVPVDYNEWARVQREAAIRQRS